MKLIEPPGDEHLVLDSLPDDVLSTIEVRDKFMGALGASGSLGFEFLVDDVRRWLPGQRLRVAFLDGTPDLHRAIAEATNEIVGVCSIRLDFAADEHGNFRRWTENDEHCSSEIRVSFDKPGYFSLVGSDSVNAGIGSPKGSVGGRPNQCSLNLGGFSMHRPASWRGTTLHEFLHALGFHHAHQNMRGPCQHAFRWEDDAGYQPTQDKRGAYIADNAGRQPGIYTYLAGYPNHWNRTKVDHNLRTEENSDLVAGPFDSESVMLYRFPDTFYRSLPSACAPVGAGQSLSAGDRRGLQLLYPNAAAAASTVIGSQKSLLQSLGAGEDNTGLEHGGPVSEQLVLASAIIKRNMTLLD